MWSLIQGIIFIVAGILVIVFPRLLGWIVGIGLIILGVLAVIGFFF